MAYGVMDTLKLALDVSQGLVDELTAVAFGSEITLYEAMVLRAGYKFLTEDQGLGGLNGLTAGLGVRLAKFGLDYAYQPLGTLTQSHRIALVSAASP